MTRHGLVGKFALLSAVAVVLLGVGLARLESGLIRNRALESARSSAQLVAQVALQSHLTPSDLQTGLSAETVKSLDQSLQEGSADKTIARAKIWSPQGTVVYSDDHSLIGRSFPIEEDLREALEGGMSSDVSSLNQQRTWTSAGSASCWRYTSRCASTSRSRQARSSCTCRTGRSPPASRPTRAGCTC